MFFVSEQKPVSLGPLMIHPGQAVGGSNKSKKRMTQWDKFSPLLLAKHIRDSFVPETSVLAFQSK